MLTLKQTRVPAVVMTVLCLLLVVSAAACAAKPVPDAVRAPAVAGGFYPGEAGKLEAAVKGFLADALPPRGEQPIAIVAPHAGYVYSAQIAADAYRQATDYQYDIVVILGTNHTTAGFNGVSVYQGTGYRTPLGVAPIDQEVAKGLMAADPSITFRPEVHEKEHSEEVQVPFVQVAFPKARIVMAVVGEPSLDLTTRFGQVLGRVLAGKRALIVASSDLSHYPSHRDAMEVDRKTLEAVASMDPRAVAATMDSQMDEGRPELVTCACGEAPIMAAIVAAKALGARRGVVVSYANSGMTVPGDESKVVGYGAVVFTAGEGGPDTSALAALSTGAGETGDAAPTEADKSYLLKLARSTIERYLATGTVPLPRMNTPALRRKAGAFVTLNENGQLRGCIGHMTGDTPLALIVARMAIEAALHDTRFEPVKASEMPDIEVEISVLTPYKQVSGPEAIEVGRDGVLIEKGGRGAVFLPQVAPEQGWTRDEMLDHLCQKAGLPGDCWHSGTRFSTFQAVVFREARAR